MNGDLSVEASPAPDAFRFGENWQRFVDQHLNPEREQLAQSALSSLFAANINGRRFLDIGAGSGLFSLAAYRLGAAEIVSIDIDPNSIATCKALRERAGTPPNWAIIHGSILDSQLSQVVESGDIVYSWGVLHHTGAMWHAIRNAASLVNRGGSLGIAIYNRVEGGLGDSRRWWHIKRVYNRMPSAIQGCMEAAYLGFWAVAKLRSRRNPYHAARQYQGVRGMALRTDIKDWLGGFPYEYAAADEIVNFCTNACGLEVVTVKRVEPRSTGNNEFVFIRS
jgi:2-polyprenyl-3-methyl-5-hydroxy-6-metoxy-1,4-benzoquinol methylase